MKRSMSLILKDKSTEELRERKKDLYKKIIIKQQMVDKYRHLMTQIAGNCSEYIREFEILDRVLFFRDRRVNVVPDRKKVSEEHRREKSIEDMSDKERDILLKQLIEIREKRKIKNE